MFLLSLFPEAKIMLARSSAGIESLEIYKHTGLMFLRNNDLSKINTDLPSYIPAAGVDTGYIFILPFVSKLLGINYFTLLNFFFYLVLFLSLFSIFYFIQKVQNKKNIFVSIFFVILTNLYLYKQLFGNVAEYLLYFYSVQLILPIGILIFYDKIQKYWIVYVILFLICLFLDQFRNYACLGSFIFLSIAVFVKKKNLISLFFIILLISVYILSPIILASVIEKKQKENYELLYGVKYHLEMKVNLPIWFTIYRGIGFINGKIKNYSDSAVIEFLKKNNINFEKPYTEKNSQILKKEIFKIFKSDPGFFMRLYASKMGVILLYFLLFLNVGLVFFIRKHKKNVLLGISFILSFLIYSIPSLMAVPGLFYLGGTIGFGLVIFCYSFSELGNSKSKIISNKS